MLEAYAPPSVPAIALRNRAARRRRDLVVRVVLPLLHRGKPLVDAGLGYVLRELFPEPVVKRKARESAFLSFGKNRACR